MGTEDPAEGATGFRPTPLVGVVAVHGVVGMQVHGQGVLLGLDERACPPLLGHCKQQQPPVSSLLKSAELNDSSLLVASFMTLQQSNNICRTAVAEDSHDSDLLHKKL